MLETILKTTGQLLLLGSGLYLVLMLYLYFNQGNMLHLPDLPGRQIDATPRQIGLNYEPVTLTAKDGVKITGWFVPVEQPRATLLFCHGNAGNISHRLDSLRLFHELGLAVFIFDYRGYGESEGEPSEAGFYRDAETAWRYLNETRKLPASEILLFGRSLGGAVAAYLAEHHHAMGLVLESTFTSVPEMAAALYPWLPARAIVRYRYDTLSRLPNIEMPVLIIHSPEDEIIPYAQGRALYAQVRDPKYFLQIHGSHNTGMLESRDSYRAGWEAFIQQLVEP